MRSDVTPVRWVVWRRKKDATRDKWEQVMAATTKTEAYKAASELELTGSLEEWEYLLIPEGKTPQAGPQWASQRIQRYGELKAQ